jgi:4-amino-4-deoxy-L-arabinose transferase-like glycosyltransferase
MTATPAPASQPASARTGVRQPAIALVRSTLAVPFALYLFAVGAGLAAAVVVTFPTNEASAYYVAVARNLAEGRGLVIDSMWSYATPPLVLPRPAFELWQPMASFLAALPMAVLGSSFLVAQLGGVLVGATVAPLTWAITRDSAPHVGTPPERVDHLAIGAGIVISLLAPFLLAVAVPDSTLSFLVFGTLACWLAPRALKAGWRWGLALGVALGLTYLSRHEAVYIGAIFLAVAVVRREGWRPLLRRLTPVVVGGAIVVAPWLLRNIAVFGTPLPGQALDNAFLTGNEQIFDYAARPSLAGFLAQGWWPIAVHIVVAGTHNLFDVTLLPGGPVTVIGAVGAFVLARRGQLSATPLAYLLGSGVLTMAVATYVFPVASLWGTFRHAAGPLIVGLTVAAVLFADRAVDGIRRRRAWQRRNAWLAPLALALLVVPITLLQLTFISSNGRVVESSAKAIATFLHEQPETDGATPRVITDLPIWLNMTSGLPTLALPAQPPEVVLRLAHDQGATLILVSRTRGAYPAAFRSGPLAPCFIERARPAYVQNVSALFEIAEACR